MSNTASTAASQATSASEQKTFRSYDPRHATSVGLEFREASSEEIEQAASLAEAAVLELRRTDPYRMADLLETMRAEILELGDSLVEQADQESALGIDRLRGERDRTVNQLKLFAGIVREGSWVDARIDTAQPDRKPLPRPDIRRALQPLGPVAVFGASNFPLAFSVAGGDTASALASRNPVIVKAHPAHPGTSELVGAAIKRAIQKNNLPAGTFSLLQGFSPEVSLGLVTNSKVKAVAFTGSQRAGRALFDAAARRPEPIPVFSEMGSTNPVFLLGSVLRGSATATAEALYKSVTLGVGQFCTCPGLVFVEDGDGVDNFVSALRENFANATPGTMLNAVIAKGFGEAYSKASGIPGVTSQTSARESDPTRTEGRPGVLVTDAQTWLGNRALHEEIFGPATLLVRCGSDAETLECARVLEGSLTATVHGSPEEIDREQELLNILSGKAGRLIVNGYPTGVEVGYAMQHGGPYPATTDSRFTSVGAAAILRFARPVCYQNFPDAALPAELQDANPKGIWRTVDGQLTRDAVRRP